MNGGNGIQPTVELATTNGNGFYPYPVMAGGFGNSGFGGFGGQTFTQEDIGDLFGERNAAPLDADEIKHALSRALLDDLVREPGEHPFHALRVCYDLFVLHSAPAKKRPPDTAGRTIRVSRRLAGIPYRIKG